MNSKCCIYIDGANLHMRTKNDGLDIDLEKFYIYLKNKYRPAIIYYFLGFTKENEGLHEYLKRCGFTLVFRESVNTGKYMKGNCDSEMVMYICRDLYKNKNQEFVIITSDGDFACVVKEVINENMKCKIISPTVPDATSKLLRKSGGEMTYIKDIYQLIKRETPDADETA